MLNQKLMGAGGAADKTYIEDVFSTYLYTGNGSTQTINNGIDLAGKGGMVWLKGRSASGSHCLYDTARGATKELIAGNTSAVSYVEATRSTGLTAFNSSGFNLGSYGDINASGTTYASWTFRKAPKFFDVVTYTGNGVAGRTISHSLGSVPGMIIVRCLNSTTDWTVYHKETGNYRYLVLNTAAQAIESGASTRWNLTTPTDKVFSVGTNAAVNGAGNTYVAYLFAHDTTTDGLIQCGVYAGNGSATGPEVNLGWEPQFIMVKGAFPNGGFNWQIMDNMRGMPVGNTEATVQANTGDTESFVEYLSPTATGFRITSAGGQVNTNNQVYIYMAIRRGPMRTPTDATKVFNQVLRAGSGTASLVNTGITTDAALIKNRNNTQGTPFICVDRLRDNKWLMTAFTDTEYDSGLLPTNMWDNQTGFDVTGNWLNANATSNNYVNYAFKRAPGFFDVVCYTGTGVVTHNLGVKPELVIYKPRNFVFDWPVDLTNHFGYLNKNNALTSDSVLASRATATTWQPYATISGVNMVAYLFASCPGVSKVGSYTGNGTSQTIDCGFTNGARFVLIKRTDSTGDWYIWDTARGIVASNDPHLSLNSNAAEVTTDDTIDPDSSGFIVNQVAATNVNVSGGSYIYLAIA